MTTEDALHWLESLQQRLALFAEQSEQTRAQAEQMRGQAQRSVDRINRLRRELSQIMAAFQATLTPLHDTVEYDIPPLPPELS
jgi:hypothetical protein